jgi:hypothetical protein
LCSFGRVASAWEGQGAAQQVAQCVAAGCGVVGCGRWWWCHLAPPTRCSLWRCSCCSCRCSKVGKLRTADGAVLLPGTLCRAPPGPEEAVPGGGCPRDAGPSPWLPPRPAPGGSWAILMAYLQQTARAGIRASGQPHWHHTTPQPITHMEYQQHTTHPPRHALHTQHQTAKHRRLPLPSGRAPTPQAVRSAHWHLRGDTHDESGSVGSCGRQGGVDAILCQQLHMEHTGHEHRALCPLAARQQRLWHTAVANSPVAPYPEQLFYFLRGTAKDRHGSAKRTRSYSA